MLVSVWNIAGCPAMFQLIALVAEKEHCGRLRGDGDDVARLALARGSERQIPLPLGRREVGEHVGQLVEDLFVERGQDDAPAVDAAVQLEVPLAVEMRPRHDDGPLTLEAVFDGFRQPQLVGPGYVSET